jgi:hypothetical protein
MDKLREMAGTAPPPTPNQAQSTAAATTTNMLETPSGSSLGMREIDGEAQHIWQETKNWL